ncbi:TPA: hypothetical protein RQK43_004513 [Vibrio vulnificus]|uniref:hypothetical protein n=1 Tax=Vibrio vulnificus TaxID=672 RepID=UPI0019D420D8|nr:hypothetical protein [Vibrio vulnificus]MBN8147711.1 hypothetical protein [Vibrio vulnificus]HAS6163756.1 hypothetical protein [Vibrio vulnificus]HDY7740751.1 hypothetical protein [Vibrio vulnificus]HDY7864703.1 hypothetical protein [Vibrio vulnificus]HDY7878561.1 hypothetical protein [Vibrio vulnificus]
MAEEYYRKSVEGLEVVTEAGKKPEPLMVTTNGVDYEPLKVTILKELTSVVEATKELDKREKTDIQDFIESNQELVSDGIERWLNESDLVGTAHGYLTEIFPNLPELDRLSEVLVELLIQLSKLV